MAMLSTKSSFHTSTRPSTRLHNLMLVSRKVVQLVDGSRLQTSSSDLTCSAPASPHTLILYLSTDIRLSTFTKTPMHTSTLMDQTLFPSVLFHHQQTTLPSPWPLRLKRITGSSPKALPVDPSSSGMYGTLSMGFRATTAIPSSLGTRSLE